MRSRAEVRWSYSRQYARMKFRLAAAERSWLDLTALVRAAAQAGYYLGPDLATLEQIGADIAAVRSELHAGIVEAASQAIGPVGKPHRTRAPGKPREAPGRP